MMFGRFKPSSIIYIIPKGIALFNIVLFAGDLLNLLRQATFMTTFKQSFDHDSLTTILTVTNNMSSNF